MNKKKILVLIDWYLPGYKAGGPIQSVANIIHHLDGEVEFAVITTDTDLHETSPYPSVKSNEWTTAPDGTRTFYFSKNNLSFSKLKEVIINERADVIYMNSLFSVPFTIMPLYIRKKFLPSRKTVLAPRGMLGAGALNIKPLKKKAFIAVAKLLGLFKHITWHASTGLEAEEVKKHFGNNAKVVTAVNLSAPGEITYSSRVKEVNTAKFVFLSRIASKKNLLTFIDTLKKISMPVSFDIYGPVDEADYWKRCEEAIAQCPAHISINYKGPVANSEVREILKTYHFSVLYTHHENFGHSIIEGMAAGCPAIISDQTPWRNLESRMAGWDISINDTSKLLQVVEKCCRMNQEEYDLWSKGALNFAVEIINNKESLAANKSLFV